MDEELLDELLDEEELLEELLELEEYCSLSRANEQSGLMSPLW